MKALLRILFRYVTSAAGVALTLLILNFSALLFWLLQTKELYQTNYRTSEVAASLARDTNGFSLDKTGEEALQQEYQWAMLLNDEGHIIWQKNLPSGLQHSYSVSDVASFSRWYLEDYPVYVWQHPDGLLVLGKTQGSIWKHGIEMQSEEMEKAITWLPGIILLNIITAVFLSLVLGIRLFRSLQPLARGIEEMAQNQPVSLPTNGLLGDLAGKLNQTSIQLQKQTDALQKRDNARTSWIDSISHDIRTPLSLVMGYASQLENSPVLLSDQKEQAHIIRTQSEKIKALITDLNLASKLEYDMQPLHISRVNMAALLRAVTADFYNRGLDDSFTIDLQLESDTENMHINGDEGLLKRALTNLVNNSIQHNPNGCSIKICLKAKVEDVLVFIEDNGKGFSQEVLEALNNPDNSCCQKHGLGLSIVRQVIRAHGGQWVFDNLPAGGCSVKLHLPAGI